MKKRVGKKQKLEINYIYKKEKNEPILIEVLKEGYLCYIKTL